MTIRRRHLAGLALASCLSACGSEGGGRFETVFDPCAPLVVAPRDDSTAEEIASVREAVALWNDRLGAAVRVDALPGAAIIPLHFERSPLAHNGSYEHKGGSIFINRNLVDARVRALTVAHELGHAFGLYHVERSVRLSVMNPGNMETAPTLADEAEVVAVWGECAPPGGAREAPAGGA